jgi:hypothetical protein
MARPPVDEEVEIVSGDFLLVEGLTATAEEDGEGRVVKIWATADVEAPGAAA